MLKHKAFTIICGHYGCGKTNLSINLATDAAKLGKDTTIVDMDIVNPYFRTSDFVGILEASGIRLIAPVYARTTMDLPMIPAEVSSVFDSRGTVIIDAGGDDAGATVLGSLADKIQAVEHDMLYVVNRYRALSSSAEQAVELLKEIEHKAGVKATGIVNNSHLMWDTTPETILDALPFAWEVSRRSGLPLVGVTVPTFVIETAEPGRLDLLDRDLCYPVEIYVRTPWAKEV